MPVFDPITQACLLAFDGRLLLWMQERPAPTDSLSGVRNGVIEQADFAADYFEQTDGNDMWNAWVIQKLGALTDQLVGGQCQPELMAEMDGWEEVLGSERLIREMTESHESSEPIIAHLLRCPAHRDRVHRGLGEPAVLQGLLTRAIQTGDETLLDGLLTVGVSPNGPSMAHATWQDLPLACSCEDLGSPETTQDRTSRLWERLLAAGADVNHYTDRRSLLHAGAVLKNNLEWAQWLVDHGAAMPRWKQEGQIWSSLDAVRQRHNELVSDGLPSPWEPMLRLLENAKQRPPETV